MPTTVPFRHQIYTDSVPSTEYLLTQPDPGPPLGSPEFERRMLDAGDAFRGAGINVVYLVHGTFVGNDAAGLWSDLARLFPGTADVFRHFSKRWVDAILGEYGNYTEEYSRLFEQSINGPGRSEIPVRLFRWSSGNHHLARADAAVKLLAELDPLPQDARVLLWGHSHAGNVFALMTQLLGSDDDAIDAFFEAARPHYRFPLTNRVDDPVWPRMWQKLKTVPRHPTGDRLDFVTFGTPIRYGWSANGYHGLLHFVNHHPVEGLPEYLTRPPSLDDVFDGTGGDCIQQLGIAGTNAAPAIVSWPSFVSDRRLGDLLESTLPEDTLLDRLKLGMRVPESGTTLLVDYGDPETDNISQHHAGHAVYTLPKWLLFHAEQTASFLSRRS